MKSKNIYLDLLINNPIELGHWLGFRDLTNLHNDWLKKLLYGKDDWTLQAHRGSYKTTVVSLAFAIHILLYPNKNVIFIRKTDNDVVEIMTQVKKIIESPHYQYICKCIYGRECHLIKANNNEITTDLQDSTRGSVQLLGIGIGGSLTGKHADWVHTDDIVNLKDRISEAERKFTKSVYMELQNVKNRGGRITNTGTPWHKEDCFELMPKAETYDCYQTNLISSDDLNKIRKNMTPSLFSANYELKHIADDNALFKVSPNYFDNSELLIGGKSHIDASYGGEDGSAFTIFNKIGDKIYVYGKLKQMHIDRCLNEYITWHKYFKCGSIFCELNGDKGYLAKEINKLGIPTITYQERMNKYIKISTYLRGSWDNIYFYKDTDNEYIQQIMDYNEDASHDDAPDSLASILRETTQTIRKGF